MADEMTLGQTLNHEFTFYAQSNLSDEQFFSQPADRIGHIALGMIREVQDLNKQFFALNKLLAHQSKTIARQADKISQLEDRVIALEDVTWSL